MVDVDVRADRERSSRRRLVVGGLIVLVGVALLLESTGAVEAEVTDLLLPLGLLVVGLALLFGRLLDRALERLFWPALLALLGALLTAAELEVALGAGGDPMELFLPLAIVLFGLLYLTRPWRRAASR